MKIAVWIVQVLLALVFLGSGAMKAFAPIEMIHANPNMGWSLALPDLVVRFIGVSELAGALGLLLPSLTRIKPKLTVAAAAGLVLVMVLAALTHIMRGEFQVLGGNFLLGGLAAFVAWARLKKVPIEPKA